MASLSYRWAKVFAVIGLFSVLVALAGFTWPFLLKESGGLWGVDFTNHDPSPVRDTALWWTNLVLAGSALTSTVALLGTASTILLGWREDRRKSQEFKLKIEQLELQLAVARKTPALKAEASQPLHA